jgi:hypothetical protein
MILKSSGMVSGKESGEEIFLEILKPKSFRIRILLRNGFRKSKISIQVGMIILDMDLDDSSGRISGKGSYSSWTFLRWIIGLFFCPIP